MTVFQGEADRFLVVPQPFDELVALGEDPDEFSVQPLQLGPNGPSEIIPLRDRVSDGHSAPHPCPRKGCGPLPVRDPAYGFLPDSPLRHGNRAGDQLR